jgi:hypothetical protein
METELRYFSYAVAFSDGKPDLDGCFLRRVQHVTAMVHGPRDRVLDHPQRANRDDIPVGVLRWPQTALQRGSGAMYAYGSRQPSSRRA